MFKLMICGVCGSRYTQRSLKEHYTQCEDEGLAPTPMPYNIKKNENEKEIKAMPREVNGIVLFPGGTFERRVFKQLSDYQAGVDGLIEAIRLYDYTYEKEVATMYVNEEGRLKDNPRINAVAGGISFLLNNESYLYGNAVVVGADDGEGYDTDIPDWLLGFIERVARDVTPNV